MKDAVIRFKIVSLGNAEVGKSCVIKRYCEKRFIVRYMMTIGIDYGVTKVDMLGKELKVNIFDMSGHPAFLQVRNEFYRDTQGVLLVYDVTDKSSFNQLDAWLDEMRDEHPDKDQLKNVVFVVCANKIDKQRVISEAEGRLWADGKGYPYFETSALTGEGVNEVFKTLLENVLFTHEHGEKPQTKLGYSKEQVQVIQRIYAANTNYEKLGVRPGATQDEVNRAYRKLAVLLHPDKNVAPGSEEAFKMLVSAKKTIDSYHK